MSFYLLVVVGFFPPLLLFNYPLTLNMAALKLSVDDSQRVCSSKVFWLEFDSELFSTLWEELVLC